MGVEFSTVEINEKNQDLLIAFLAGLDNEQLSFRYFKNRSIEAIRAHLFTCLLEAEGESVAYGHLDKEADRVWLGIVVKQEFQGKGYAKKIMQVLIDKGKELRLNNITLSVDLNNEKAAGLYQRFGFRVISKNQKHTIYQKEL